MKPTRTCLVCVCLLLIFAGLFSIVISPFLLKYIIRNNLVLIPESRVFESWEHLPELVPMDFYFFNWTNPKEIYNTSSKPRFQEVGPYRFMMDLEKKNISWNENGTVTYKQEKHWYFDPEGTKGSLQDTINTLNTPVIGAAHVARTWNYLVRKGLSFTLNRLYPALHVTRTIDELMFTGYPDPLTKMASSLPIFAGADLPKWDKFGYFYKRNGSTDLDGVYNMGTGVDSVFAEVYRWNYWSRLPFFEGECGKVDGFTGDNFKLDSNDWIEMFVPDLCRPMHLQGDGEAQVDGLEGKRFIFGDKGVDNGTKFPKNKCFYPGESIPSGVFNVTICRQGAPVFMSLPHFHRADPYYRNLVEGLEPNKEKHEFSITVEPNTGIPLEVKGRLQLNFLLQTVPAISLFETVPKVYFPIFWFDQRAAVPRKQLPDLKLLLSVPTILVSIGCVMGATGLILLIYLIMTTKKALMREEDVPLKPEQNHK